VSDNRHGQRWTPRTPTDGLSQARRAAALAARVATWLRDEEALGGRAVAAVSSGARRRLRRSRCRIEPYWIKAAPLRSAAARLCAGLGLGRPARRAPGHTRAGAAISSRIRQARSTTQPLRLVSRRSVADVPRVSAALLDLRLPCRTRIPGRCATCFDSDAAAGHNS